MRLRRLGLAVKVGSLSFADDFVGLTTNVKDLQTSINVVLLY